MARVKKRDELLLASIERLVTATLTIPPSRTGTGSGADVGDESGIGSIARAGILPGTPGALVHGVSGNLVPICPSDDVYNDGMPRRVTGTSGVLLSMPSTSSGTAREKIGASKAIGAIDGKLHKDVAGRILRAYFDLMYK